MIYYMEDQGPEYDRDKNWYHIPINQSISFKNIQSALHAIRSDEMETTARYADGNLSL